MRIILLYSGLKVKVKDPDKNLSGSLINSYKTLGCLYIVDVLDNDTVVLSYSPRGAITTEVDTDLIEPIYDEDLSKVLEAKREEAIKLMFEIYDIRSYINNESQYQS